VQDNPRIDPGHHFVFAGEQWPTIRFGNVRTMDQPWWGGRPFLSGHNARPTYHVVGTGDARQLRLGPVSYGVAPIGPERIEPGRYLVTARVRSTNTHGPGGRIELLALKRADLAGNGYVRMDAGNILREEIRYFGNGTFDWRDAAFVAEVPVGTGGLALGLGNGGTGEVLVEQVRIEPWGTREAPASSLSSTPPAEQTVPDALWDLRMRERQGLYVYNHGTSAHRTLELANLDWVEDAGRPALRFAENPVGRADYPPLGILDLNVRHPVYRTSYQPVSHGAFALGGHHGGGSPLAGLTLSAWINPAEEMGKSHHQGKGDIVGYGARRFILGLQGQTAPYRLVARINVNDRFESEATLEANRWRHVALTATPTEGQWRIRLFLDGQEVATGMTKQSPADAPVSDSLILGGELFYLHDAYYRGLIGEVQVIGRALSPEQLQTLSARGR
jgi:hypothetical protein